MAATPSEPPASRPAPPDVVVPLTRADLPAAAAVLAAALADDPGFRHLFPVDARRERELQALYRMTLSDALAYGHTYVTKLDGVVTGAVALYAPGTYPMTTRRWWRQSLRIVAIALRTRTHSLGLIKFGDATAEGVPADAWYVEALGGDCLLYTSDAAVGQVWVKSGLPSGQLCVPCCACHDPAPAAWHAELTGGKAQLCPGLTYDRVSPCVRAPSG